MKEPNQGVSSTAGSPVSDAFAAMDARIRRKLDMGQALTDEERAFFANLPGSKKVTPAEVQAGRAMPEHDHQ